MSEEERLIHDSDRVLDVISMWQEEYDRITNERDDHSQHNTTLQRPRLHFLFKVTLYKTQPTIMKTV